MVSVYQLIRERSHGTKLSGKFKDHTKSGFLPLQRIKRDHTARYPDKDRSRSTLLLSHWNAGVTRGLQKLVHKAFFGCKKLRKVYIPENVTYLGEEAFHGFNWMEYLVIHHDPEYIGTRIVNKNCTIRCKKGSKMDAYCEVQGLQREYIWK